MSYPPPPAGRPSSEANKFGSHRPSPTCQDRFNAIKRSDRPNADPPGATTTSSYCHRLASWLHPSACFSWCGALLLFATIMVLPWELEVTSEMKNSCISLLKLSDVHPGNNCNASFPAHIPHLI
mmetsp:Transcript_6230/g.7148  ORF Transcript_6230/g.7148 Transcript_6230/m.7148 type:complete len:124 (-) Transcript_6230:422-793(-)